MKFPDIIFSSGLDRALGWMVVHSIWQAALIAVVFGILLLLLRHKPARLRYWVANAGLLAVLLCAGGTFLYYFQETGAAKDLNLSLQANGNVDPGSTALKTAEMLLSPNNPALDTGDKTNVSLTFQDYFNRNLPLIVVIWFLGIAVFLLRLLGNISFVYYLRGRMNFPADEYWSDMLRKLAQKAGFSSKIDVLESALVRSPITIGYLKPLILFPVGIINRLSESEVEAILAHELAHVLRRDYLFNILQSIVEALFYYHPAVWWLSAQARNERECACDEKAIVLTGNKMNYAKALVTMQEMAFYPLSPALAFAGQRQSQLLQRVRRIFQQPNANFNIMEKWIATAVVVCSIIALTFGQRYTNSENIAQFNQTRETPDFKTGIWQATFEKDTAWITFTSKSRNGSWNSSEYFLKNDIAGWPAAQGPVSMQITHPAGTMAMNGQLDADGAYGKYKFTPDENYRASLAQQGMKDADDELMLHCFYASLPADYLTFLKKQGFESIDKDKFQEVAIFRLDEAAVKETKALMADLGNTKPQLEELIEFRIHGIDRAYVVSLKKAGYGKLSADEIRDFKIQGIDAEFIHTMNKKNGDPLSAEEMVNAKIFGLDKIDRKALEGALQQELSNDELNNFAVQGIDETFIQNANNLGFGKLSADEIVNVKIQGIDADFVKMCNDMGFGKLNFDEVMNAKIQGVDADFVKSCSTLDLGKLSFDEVMNIKIQDIDPKFVKECQELGFGKLDMDQVMNVKIQGIDAKFVKECQNLGFGKLSFDDVMNMKIQGIDADFVKQCNNLGFGKLSLDDVMNIKIQDIDTDFIKQCNDFGLGKLSLEEVMNAKIQGITKEFIQESNQKGYKFPDLDSYIQLKMLQQRRSE